MAQGDFSWAIYDNYTPQHDNYIFDLDIDADNNLISVGRSSKSSGSDNQLIIYKHDSDGNEVWQTTFNYSQYLMDAQVKVSQSYDIVVTAAFRGDLTIGSTVYNAANQQEDIAIIKMDKDGAVLWTAHDGRSDAQERSYTLAVDGNGNVYYGAYHQGFNTYIGTDTLTGGGQTFIASYDVDGNYRWVSLCSKGLKSIDVDGTHIYAYGTYGSGFNSFADSSISATTDVFIARFDLNGNFVSVANEDEVVPKHIMVDDSRVYTTGLFTSAASVGGATLTPANSVDSYIGYYGLDLSAQSAYHVTAGDYSNGVALAKSSNGHYCLMGNHGGDVTFAGTTINASGFSHNVYVLEFDASDNEVEIYGVIGESASTATEIEEAALCAGSNDDFYINGYLKGKGLFGTQSVDPGGNHYHMWLAQIGEAGATGIEDITVEKVEMKVYPNPFSHQVNIAFDRHVKGDLVLLDLSGRVVMQRTVTRQQETLQVGHLTPGSYYLNVTLKSGERFMEQVMVF